MIKRSFITIITISLLFFSCKKEETNQNNVQLSVIQKINNQYDYFYPEINKSINQKRFIPRSIHHDSLKLVSAFDWTSGFYPGTLWNIYKLTNDKKWQERAKIYTEKLSKIQYWEGNHDVGFIIECSYGNGIKYGDLHLYDSIIVNTAKALSTRFKPKAGIIQSWNANKKWNCPVIIDNMMNLELLFHATKISGDSTYYNIATTHANTTIKNHFRSDYSSFHVIDYDSETGDIIQKKTHQGFKDNSSWARGQSWGLYGYTMCFRETKNQTYLQQAMAIANYIINNKNIPTDKIPLWDYNAPKSKETPRDASAAAITASALFELHKYVDEENSTKYLNYANDIMSSLASKEYFADYKTNEGFILKHSVGSIPHGTEIDAPLNYADYYYTEALIREQSL
ncbi:glucuronyl hydrolase [Joostella sp. CR20]|uniref:glucuronyl hydrolase n=1 Tax=Joostella sp. CR20 TaxID=2804312 RepID=UPI00313BA9F4